VINKKLVLLLSLCVVGSFVPLKANIIVQDCAADLTLGGVFADGGTCTIGAYSFTFDPNEYTHNQSGGGTPTGGLLASHLDISDLINAHGTGFRLTPDQTFDATSGGNNDIQLAYFVTGTNINAIYLEVDGTVVGPGTAQLHVLEDYCLGVGVAGPPPGGTNTSCPGNAATGDQSTPLNATISSGSAPATASATFNGVSSITALKDIDAFGGNGTSATLSSVINQWGPAVVPEPGTYLLSCIGLGLMFLGARKYSRS
jgi:hypothetical protein